eukprot:2059288-Pleurochrysis_carterae.AAC.2
MGQLSAPGTKRKNDQNVTLRLHPQKKCERRNSVPTDAVSILSTDVKQVFQNTEKNHNHDSSTCREDWRRHQITS